MPKIATDDLLRSLIEIREAFDEMPLPLATMLLAVSHAQGRSPGEIGKAAGAPRRLYYRQLQRLGSGDFTGPGLNLVAALPHPDGRSNAIYLTRAGQRMVERIRGGDSERSRVRARTEVPSH
jgi:hypothetical protein